MKTSVDFPGYHLARFPDASSFETFSLVTGAGRHHVVVPGGSVVAAVPDLTEAISWAVRFGGTFRSRVSDRELVALRLAR